MSLEELRLVRPASELVADIRELLDLYSAICEPVEERLHPVVWELLGDVELIYMPIGLRLQSEVRSLVSALPGDDRQAFTTHLTQQQPGPEPVETAVQPSVEDVLAQIGE